jgi:hypothetical protein
MRGPRGWPVGVLTRAGYRAGEISVEFYDQSDMAAGTGDGEAVCCVAEESSTYQDIAGVLVRGVIVAKYTTGFDAVFTRQDRQATSGDRVLEPHRS